MDLVEKTITYLNENLGVTISHQKRHNEKSLPPYIRHRYELYNAQILNTPCLLLIDKEAGDSTPAAIKKHLNTIHKKEDTEAVYVCSSMESYNRKRLIERKVSFIVPGNQMYLPFLGIDLREHMKTMRSRKESLSPSAQLLTLSLLLGQLKSGITPGETARLFSYSSMTMTRAFDELKKSGIGRHISEGKRRLLTINEKLDVNICHFNCT